ncbi:hypothetical protein DK926_04915 [Rhodococcus sp. Eu-32]|uniref:hypothetical protein n=1 Tax=Rhodococcus sp. Eu-32 TaxID=1017319 RepID=UPI000DF4720E|nr:hypothetical protein [Rhodococcus sp. Eu-32]RRQ29225.1 hypothetical protein DK926_04915 [Rhodococcus sp. Eu-32]
MSQFVDAATPRDDDAWIVDDVSVADEVYLHRRVKKIPTHFETKDWMTGEAVLHPAAYRLDNDGMSVQIDTLLNRCPASRDDLCEWGTYGVGVFAARVPRSAGGGVIASEDERDSILGKAHGLVRPRQRGDKVHWRAVRKELIKNTRWFPKAPIVL